MRIYGYARVSTKEQNLERQLEALKIYNKDIIIFKDKESGKNFDRKEYEIIKRVVAPGDTIVVKEMDRLGRNKEMIKQELEYYRKMEVRVVILDIPTTTTDISNMEDGIAKEMIKMINNILIEVLATMAEAERNKLRKRQAEGISLMPVDENGKRISSRAGKGAMGRPAVTYPDNWREVYGNWKSGDITAVKAMELTGLKKNTFYSLVSIEECYYKYKDLIKNTLMNEFDLPAIESNWDLFSNSEKLKLGKIFKKAVDLGRIKNVIAVRIEGGNQIYKKVK